MGSRWSAPPPAASRRRPATTSRPSASSSPIQGSPKRRAPSCSTPPSGARKAACFPPASKDPRGEPRGILSNRSCGLRSSLVAASVSERSDHHSLTLVATSQPSEASFGASDPKRVKAWPCVRPRCRFAPTRLPVPRNRRETVRLRTGTTSPPSRCARAGCAPCPNCRRRWRRWESSCRRRRR